MHKRPMARKLVFQMLALGTVSSCVTKTLSIKSPNKSRVSLVSPNNLEDEGTALGETPVTIEVKDLNEKFIKISQNGKQSVFLFVTDGAAENTEMTINLSESLAASDSNFGNHTPETKTTLNRLLRLLMRSYQALSGQRFKEAIDLAHQAAQIDPEIAAPWVIKGLALYQEGKLPEARTALTKAQALDPEDRGLETLLKQVTP
jgi:tetratricopeptide (TPR) repeat protein